MKDGLGRVKSVLVLGGDSDIGVAIAQELVRRGAREVLLAGRNLSRLDQRASQLKERGAMRVETARFDGDDVDSHDSFFADAVARFTRFDVVVLAFAVLGDQDAIPGTPGEAVRVARTNYLGAVSSAVHAADVLVRQGQGTLVVLSSVAAQRPRRSNYLYGSTKAGLDAFAEGLAFDLRDRGVQVLTVRPGFVDTKMTTGMRKAPFSTTPDKVASATADAIASGAELIWTPWQLHYLMMVMKLVPRPLFRRLKV